MATTRIASSSVAKVRAGDLITVDFMNGIIDWLGNLDTRITALETTPTPQPIGVTITSIVGTSTPIRVGMRLTVNGTGFMQPASLNTVTVGGVSVPSTSFGFDSSEARLSLDIPNVPGLPTAGSSLPVVVSNANGSARRDATILPALVVPSGRVEVTYTAAPVGTIAAGQSFIFTYTVNAIVDQTATYNVVPSIINVTGWTATLVEDGSDQARLSNTISIPASTRQTLRIRVAIPAGTTGTGTLRVDVTSAVAGTNIQPGSSSPIALTIGSAAPVPDNRVTISLTTSLPIQNGRVMVTRGSTLGARFSLAFTDAGITYTVTPSLRIPTGWAAAEARPATFLSVIGTNALTVVALSPGTDATDTDLVLVVTGTNGFRGEYNLPLGIS
jgi:hypothetical protein